ncbi:MAG: ATP-binding protein [Myxococcota bacterium]
MLERVTSATDRFLDPEVHGVERARLRFLVGAMVAAAISAAGAAVVMLALGNVVGAMGGLLAVLANGAALALVRRGRSLGAALLFNGSGALLVNGFALTSGGATSPVFAVNAAIVALASATLPGRAVVGFVGLPLAVALFTVLAPETVESWRVLEESRASAAISQMLGLGFIWLIVGSMVGILGRAVETAAFRERELNDALERLERTSVSKAYIDKVLRGVRDMILVTDPHGHVLDANPAAVERSGFSQTELLAMNVMELVEGTGSFEESELEGYSSRMRHADGRMFAVLLSRGRLEGGAGLVWAISDISVQQAAMEAIRRSHSQAEEANVAKSRFLATMSHELRTPLNAIIGYAELIDDQLDGPPDVLEDIRRIRTAGTHLLGLINGILDLSKIEAGKLQVFLEDVEPRAFIDDVIGTVRPHASRKGLELRVEVPDTLGLVRVDETKTRQILLNLMSNAIKFTGRGSVTLAVELYERAGTPWIQFEVSDTGIGMNEADADRVFEPFVQGDDTTVRAYGGTGLGLSIALAFARMMGGRIAVHSELGVGSQFRVDLPAGEPAWESLANG